MKIFHIITSLKMGGAEAFLYNFLSHVVHNKDEEHVVAYFHAGPYVDKIKALGIKTYQIKGLFVMYDLFAYARLKKIIKNYKPDLLHTSLWSANFLGRLLSRQLSIPIMCELHGNCALVSSCFKNWLDRKTVAIPQRNIAVADSVKMAYQQHVIGAVKDSSVIRQAQARLMVIKNGIDVDYLLEQASVHPLRRHDIGLEEDDFVVGSVGRFEAIKSYDVLIAAFAMALKNSPRNQSFKLCLVGDGQEREKLKKLVETLGIAKSVIFTGVRTDAYRIYPLFNCFALSSQTEGLSLALLEALAFGLPIVTTNIGTQHEVIMHGVHGFLVPVNDSARLAQALEVLYNDQDLVQRMKFANQELITSFKIDAVVNQYRAMYQEVLKA